MNPTIITYDVVSKPALAALITEVNTKLSEGWGTVGGVGHDGVNYLQAINISKQQSA